MYTLLSMGLIKSTKEIGSVTTMCVNARISGTFDDECFVDNRRRVAQANTWSDLDEYREWCSRIYRRDCWQDQLRHIECWLEKDTTSFLVESTTKQWGIPLRVSTGYFSRPFLCRAARDIGDLIKPVTIVYIGDHDPTGLDIERAARRGNGSLGTQRREGLFDILEQKYDWDAERFYQQISWKRIGTTHPDFLALPNSAKVPIKQDKDDENGERLKRGDPRAAAYKEEYGEFGAEVEALEVHYPGLLAERVENEIKGVINFKLWEESEARETVDKEKLQAA
jgi:hypothetical protein